MRPRWRDTALALALATAGCGPGTVGDGLDTGLDGLAVSQVRPGTLVPGSTLVVTGSSFVPEYVGESRLVLTGSLGAMALDVRVPLRFVDYTRLEGDWNDFIVSGLPARDGQLLGEAVLEVDSLIDGRTYRAEPVAVSLEIRSALTPRLDVLESGVIFVNDPITVEGDGLLLGGGEGDTVAVVEGCYTETMAQTCVPVGPAEVVVRPETPFDRTRGTFAFHPRIAGIQPGRFQGTVRLRNRHGAEAGSQITESAPRTGDYDVVPPAVYSVDPPGASLGQYVDIRGGGFVGVAPGAPNPEGQVTLLELDGTFTPDGAPGGVPATLTLVPDFHSGPLVRYVVNEDDELGQAVDLRRTSGTFTGQVRPVVRYGADSVAGDWTSVTLRLLPVKQVVWIDFRPSYVESLRHFGLRALDARLRARILEVLRRDFAGVNIEFREESPEDFALFSTVEVSGPDPNGLGLLGYDNTPGKDTDNLRLYDKIGGVNATTQEDGYPGYGGIFVESFFGFSQHPGGFAEKIAGADPAFDDLFDPFRPDQGGKPVLAGDLGAGIPALENGDACPAPKSDRSLQISCALWALGNLIGTTLSHEIGHSLGLANPYGVGFHNSGDLPDRLMDAGSARTFAERAELFGEGPSRFCDEEYDYLRDILRTSDPAPNVTRPPCF